MTDPLVRRLARQIHKLSRETRTQARASQAARRSVEIADGPVAFYDNDGTVRALVGPTGDGSVTTQEFNFTPPPQPTPPDVNQVPGGVEIVWDGTFEEANAPADWSHTEIHASALPDFEQDDTTQVGSFVSTSGGVFSLTLDPAAGTWYFALVAVNRSGVESPKSAEVAQSGGNFGVPTPEVPDVSPLPVVTPGLGRIYVEVPASEVTFGLTYQLHVSIDPDFVPVLNGPTLVKEFQSTFTSFDADAAGDPLVTGTEYFVRIIAYNDEGDAPPSGMASGSRRAITGPDIAADQAWLGTLTVDRLMGGELQVEAVLSGNGGVVARGAAGESVGIFPDGFRVKGPTALGNPTYVDFPTDSGKPNIISGVLQATTLEVAGDPNNGLAAATLHGKSTLANDAELRMSTGVQAQVAAPGYVFEYTTADITYADETIPPVSQPGAIRGGFWDGTHYYFVDSGPNKKTVYWMDVNGVVQGHHVFNDIVAVPGSSSWPKTYGITKIGTKWYVLVLTLYSSLPWPFVLVYNEDWTPGGPAWRPEEVYLSHLYDIAITTDGVRVLFGHRNVDDHFVVDRYNTDGTLHAAGVYDAAISSSAWDNFGPMAGIRYGAFDFGGNRLIIQQVGRVLVFDAANTRHPDEEWPLAAYAAGIFYDGTRFRSVLSGSMTLLSYSRNTWTVEDPTWWISQTRYDPAGPYETVQSPLAKLTMVKRAYLRVTANYSGSAGARVYVGRGAADPGRANMKRNAELLSPLISTLIDKVLFGVDAPPPAAGNFPGTAPAQIVSSDGATFWKANGDARFKNLVVSATQDLTALTGNLPALRLGDPAAAHMRLDNNQIQAMADDDSIANLLLQIEPDAAGGIGGVQLGRLSQVIKSIRFGFANPALDVNGAGVFNHGLPGAPVFAAVGGYNASSNFIWTVRGVTATQIQVRAVLDTGAAAAAANRDCWWIAIYN